jgi:hypothetical protein
MNEAALVKFTRNGTQGQHTVTVEPELFPHEEPVQVIERLMAILEPDNQLITVTLIPDQLRGTRSPAKRETPAQMATKLGFSQLSYEINSTIHSVVS